MKKIWKIDTVSLFFQKYGAVAVFLLLVLVNAVFTPNFVNVSTMWNIIAQMTPIMYISVGMTFVIGTSGIDLSVGSTLAFCSIILARMLQLGYPVLAAIGVILLIGAIIGIFNGFMVSKMGIQPIILTIVMQMILRGFAIFVSEGKSIPITNSILSSLGLHRFQGGVPIQIIYVGIILAVGWILAKKMALGSYVEAIGDNEKAAFLAGVRIVGITVLVYMLSGVMSALAGVLEAARSGAVDPSIVGDLYEVDAIAATAIGGTSLDGGKPNIIGTFFGVMTMILITMTINMNNIPYEISNIVKAFIILFSLYMRRESKA
ncbi:ABC transporter permease [Candidatus Merdisoma sp. JLR.KK006]|uniref:ABC transporter permease n=1 Tax=Candidatus Merdisoma sp. JLR.KK006 TaxID=3112626 RepID=UPI002FEFD64F